jgi:hypothetical protein
MYTMLVCMAMVGNVTVAVLQFFMDILLREAQKYLYLFYGMKTLFYVKVLLFVCRPSTSRTFHNFFHGR